MAMRAKCERENRWMCSVLVFEVVPFLTACRVLFTLFAKPPDRGRDLLYLEHQTYHWRMKSDWQMHFWTGFHYISCLSFIN